MNTPRLFSIVLAGLSFGQAIAADLPREPADPDGVDPSLWESVGPGLHSGFGSLDVACAKSKPPSGNLAATVTLQGWRGERVQAMLLVWSADTTGRVDLAAGDLRGKGFTIRRDRVSISTLRYVLTSGFRNERGTSCGPRDNSKIPAHLSPDLLSGESGFMSEIHSTRPVWITLDIPAQAPAGTYTGAISMKTKAGTVRHTVTVEVQDKLLPPPSEWSFHLDLWQNPFIVARYYQVEPWSKQHLDLLRPLLRKLADAGQKCISATIIHKPWPFDDFQSMVMWTRKADGTWKYDYGIFDQYVDLAMECGIRGQINCYSMVPVSNTFFWFDEAAGKTVAVEMTPGTKSYDDLWRGFLPDFREHLRKRGWFDRTTLALDERSHEEMLGVLRLLDETAPEFKVALAGFHYDDITPRIFDFSSNWRYVGLLSGKVAAARREAGLKTTFYVACAVPRPNNFTFSPPAESCYEGWFAAAAGFDGFLRWAYNCWTPDPLVDSRHIEHPPGDTFMVYPGPRSSVRFERLREGIQDFEKIRILRRNLAASSSAPAAAALKRLDDFLGSINRETLETRSAAEVINQGKELLHRIAETVP